MTIDQLIEELQKAKARLGGNLPVTIATEYEVGRPAECVVTRLNDIQIEPRGSLFEEQWSPSVE